MKKRMLACLLVVLMLVSALPVTALAAPPGGGGGNGYNHIDVRVAGKLTIATKVNGVVTSSQEIDVDVSNVSATLNGTAITDFYEKDPNSTGDEHEWRTSKSLNLNPATDKLVVTCTVTGTINGTPVTLNVSKSYSTEAALRALIAECPGNNGYDIDILAEDLTEYFTVDVTVNKVWADGNNQDGLRPTSISVQLYADGVASGAAQTLSADNNWTVTYSDLAKYNASGKEIAYTVQEVNVPEGYTASVSGYTITNTHTPEVTSVSGSKTWADGNNQDGLRPTSITINLLADGVKIDSKTVTAAENWAWSFDNLPVYQNGQKITYTITEEAVAGYTPAVDGYNVTNTHTPEVTSVSGSKTWADGNNQDGLRPTSITINLLADGVKIDSKTVTAAENWAWSFDNLPVYKNGQKITYTITEEAVTGYTSAVDGYNVTNTHTPAVTNLTVTKTWADGNNQDGKRPASITVQLKANGVPYGEPVVLNEENGWAYTWNGMAVNANGQKIAYTVEEVEVPGYTTTYDGLKITNTHVPETYEQVSVTKVWDDADDHDGKRPESIKVTLKKNGADYETVELNAGNNWSYSWSKLPVYENGQKITYAVEEAQVRGYNEPVVTGSAAEGFTVTNTRDIELTSIDVTKVWDDNENQDGKRPASITVTLYANGEATDKTLTLNEENNWSGTFADLVVYSNRVAVTYTVVETAVTGYETTESWNEDGTAVTITNTHTPEVIEVLTATKVWEDGNDQDGQRPASITINLLADGVKIDSKTVTADDGWKASFVNLPKYADGKEIVYTVTEEAVSGYTTTVDGLTITNTHTPATTSVSVSKVWDDSDNQDGKRPEVITVTLYADGVDTQKTVTLNEENQWTAVFTDLPEFANGVKIVYTVAENKVEGYTPKIEEAEGGFTITNSYDPEITSVQVLKVWDDAGNQDGIRPDEVVITLYANGKKTDKTLTLTAEGKWTGAFEELDKYEGGKEIEYTVKEESDPTGYKATSIVVDSATGVVKITNTHETAVTEVTVNKEWADSEDQDGIRPDEVTVHLYANGEKIETAKLNEKNGWSYTFKNLDLNANGKAVKYTVEEEAVKGYTTTYKEGENGWWVVNTHEAETKDVTVSKVWYDNKNASKLRPDSITAQLYKNGKAWGDKFELNSKNGWKADFELPVYEDGKKIEWTVKEVKVPKWYSVSYKQATLTIMNTIQSDGSAKTGDFFDIWTWVGLMGFCAAAAGATLVLSKKKKA